MWTLKWILCEHFLIVIISANSSMKCIFYILRYNAKTSINIWPCARVSICVWSATCSLMCNEYTSRCSPCLICIHYRQQSSTQRTSYTGHHEIQNHSHIVRQLHFFFVYLLNVIQLISGTHCRTRMAQYIKDIFVLCITLFVIVGEAILCSETFIYLSLHTSIYTD